MSAASGRGPVEELEGFSPAAIVIHFDPPLCLLRVPVPACPADEPAAGPFVLAFPSSASWRTAWRAAEANILEQCEAGARAGCSIAASNKCKLPWWKLLFGSGHVDIEAREACEEREMACCLAAAKDACVQFSRQKCLVPFREARIATDGLLEISDSIKNNPGLFNANVEATTCRGSDVMDYLLHTCNDKADGN